MSAPPRLRTQLRLRRDPAPLPYGWSGHQNGRSLKPAGAEIGERFIGLCELVRDGPRRNTCCRRDLEELATVGSREICDRQDLSLLPDKSIRKGRDVAHVDATAN